jgi:ubiquinone/menaquinone biosynthesis C-methylase UbiE
MRQQSALSNSREIMATFWERKAHENPYYYISSFQQYEQPNAEEFFAVGRELALKHLREAGYWPQRREVMLEIGCGIGRMTKTFAGLFREVHAVDISPEMIRQAQDNLRDMPNTTCYVGNGVDLSQFQNGQFDFAYCYLVMQHMPTSEIVFGNIREVARVLKPGATFRFQLNTTPPRPAVIDAAVKLKSKVHDMAASALGRKAPSELHSPAWKGAQVDVKELLQLVAANGLEVSRIDGRGTIRTWLTCVKKK